MDDLSITDILTSVKAGESLNIRYDENLSAVVFEASKELYHRGPCYRMQIRMSAMEIAIQPPEHKEIYVRNTLRTVLEKVREEAQDSRR